MKRIILGILLCILMVGCGNKTLTSNKETLDCRNKTSASDIEFLIDFYDNKVKDVNLNTTIDISQYSEAVQKYLSTQDWCAKIKNSFSKYNDAFEKCDYEFGEKEITIKAILDAEKMSNGVTEIKSSINDAKTSFELNGYTCTINR